MWTRIVRFYPLRDMPWTPCTRARDVGTDPAELTFILLARPAHETSSFPLVSPEQLREGDYRMIGDVNMFLPDGLKEDGECEIMIAGTYSA